MASSMLVVKKKYAESCLEKSAVLAQQIQYLHLKYIRVIAEFMRTSDEIEALKKSVSAKKAWRTIRARKSA